MTEAPYQYRHVLDALPGVTGGGPGKWYAFCPAHEDGKRSLSVTVKDDGRLYVRCCAPARCSTKQIMTAVGLTMEDLYPDNRRSGHVWREKPMAAPVKVYAYEDEVGTLLYEVCRYEPKRFSQRRPNPDYVPGGKKYLTDLGDVRRVVWRLPQLIAAWAERPDRWVWVVEGERDVESAEAMGLLATTSPMGAEHPWLPEYSETFRGRNVAVGYDLDPIDPKRGFRAGLKHAEDVCRGLTGVAKCVKLIRYPGLPDDQKLDFTDWCDANKSLSVRQRQEVLWREVSRTPAWFPAFSHLDETERAVIAVLRACRSGQGPPDFNRLTEVVEEKILLVRDNLVMESARADLIELAGLCAYLAEGFTDVRRAPRGETARP